MCHSTRTTEKHYMLNAMAHAAVEGHRVLAANLGLKDTEATPANQQTEQETEDLPPSSPSSGLTQLELDDIDLLFAEHTNTNKPLTILQVKKGMSDSLHLMPHLNNHQIIMKIYKCMKYLQDKHVKAAIKALPEEHDKDQRTSEWLNCGSNTSTSTSRHFTCSAEDEITIEKEFEAYQQCPRKATIHHEFRSVPSLKDISDCDSML